MELKILQIREATGTAIMKGQDVADLMAEEGNADREAFWVLHLNTKGKLIEKELVALGTLNHASIHPREVFRKAVINSTASIITVHNHPSGNLEPSSSDRKIWEKLEQSGDILGIEVIDQIIISPSGGFYSREKERR